MSQAEKRNQAIEAEVLELLNGSKLRSQFTQQQWDDMIHWGDAAWADAGLQGAESAQPLDLWSRAFAHYGQQDVFKSNYRQGVHRGVWVQDQGTDAGVVYNTQIGQPGHPEDNQGQWAGATHSTPGTGQGLPPGVPPPPNTGKGTGTNAATQKANNAATYTQILTGMGIPMTDNLQNLINNAAQHGWNSSRFLNALYGQPEFHDKFPGIFNADGTLKMSPAQYLQSQKQYESYASRYGVNLNPKTEAYLFQNNVSPAEFGDRAAAISTLRDNKQMFAAFNSVRKAEGKPELSKNDQMRMILGEGNHEWYRDWNRANSTYAAKQAGIAVMPNTAGDMALGRGLINKNANLGLSASDLASGYQALAHNLMTLMPQSRYQGLGITKKQLDILQFGGKNREAIAARVQQIVDNENAREKGTGAAFIQNQAIGSRGGANAPASGY